jgi:hypothetical protein
MFTRVRQVEDPYYRQCKGVSEESHCPKHLIPERRQCEAQQSTTASSTASPLGHVNVVIVTKSDEIPCSVQVGKSFKWREVVQSPSNYETARTQAKGEDGSKIVQSDLKPSTALIPVGVRAKGLL